MPTEEQLRLLRRELARIGCYSWEYDDIYIVMCRHFDTFGWPPAGRMAHGFQEAVERMVAIGDLYGHPIHTRDDFNRAFKKPGRVLNGDEWQPAGDFEGECGCGGIYYQEGSFDRPRWVCLNCGKERAS
ncbi:MAG: hypothetical protein IT210_23290 [Armatimonadetes bacterium]|nr:hypothetical protein [Armatimonadota bacterium]